MFRLVAQDGTQYPLTSPATTIGREACDILLVNDDLLSRRHAKIEQRGDTWVLVDLDSTNGTFVNGVRLRAPHTLQPGDTVRVGNTALTVHTEGGAPHTRQMEETPPWQVSSAPGPGVPPQPTPLPAYPPPPAPGPGAPPYPAPASVYQAPPTYGQPTKDKSIAYILEFLLLGLGWIYAGETGTGIAILVGWIVVGLGIGITVDVATGGLGCLCTGPLSILAYVLSLTQLNKYMKSRPHVFR